MSAPEQRWSGPPLGPSAAPNVVAALAANARAHPRRVAMRQYRLGRWHEMMWLDVATATARVAAGLQRLGVRPGDHVGLISSNRPEWVIAELAAQSLGAVTVGIDPGWPDLHVRAVLAAADCRAVVEIGRAHV